MNLKTMAARHEQEINDYWQQRAKRLFELQRSQNEIMSNCVSNPKAHKPIKKLLIEQRNTWEKMEKEELDMLLHIQALEKENKMKDEAKRLRLIEMLSSKSDKDKDRGR
jgi:hypothetical protein